MIEDRIEGNGDKRLGHGGDILVRIFHGVFKLIDRPWKMYPLGVLFGLGFDIQLLLVEMHNHSMLRGCPLFLELDRDTVEVARCLRSSEISNIDLTAGYEVAT